MKNFTNLFRKEVVEQTAYNAGIAVDRFREVYGIECIAKLDSNENPYGPSPNALKAIENGIPDIASYPDAGTTDLRTIISRRHNLPVDQIITGNGSEDLIPLIYDAILHEGDNIVTTCPSFGPHEFAALACGATATKIKYHDDWRFPVNDIIEALALKPKVLMFASPNNPAGSAVTEQDFDKIIKALTPDTLFVFDEAYIDFIDPDVSFDAIEKLCATNLPWISLRTFSKAYGLAGIRIGYALCADTSICSTLLKIRTPFAVNALAISAAIAAFEDKTHLEMCVSNTRKERERLSIELKQRGYNVAPSQTNFLFFDCKENGDDFAEKLRCKGILTKGWKEEPYLNWLRVSIGLPEHNDAFLKALSEI